MRLGSRAMENLRRHTEAGTLQHRSIYRFFSRRYVMLPGSSIYRWNWKNAMLPAGIGCPLSL
jgi:hypothetical protein